MQLSQILQIGMDKTLSFQEQKRVRILNRILFLGNFINVIFLVSGYFSNLSALHLPNILATVFLLINYIFLYYKKYRAAYLYAVIYILLIFLVFPLLLGEKVGAEYYLFLAAPATLILFDSVKIAKKVFFVSISIFLGIKSIFTFQLFEPLIPLEIENVFMARFFMSSILFRCLVSILFY